MNIQSKPGGNYTNCSVISCADKRPPDSVIFLYRASYERIIAWKDVLNLREFLSISLQDFNLSVDPSPMKQ